ncbi:MAG: hypothetical protein PVG39_26150 [Desulfobacteraceae bacterium]|jgi:hypothetical protein
MPGPCSFKNLPDLDGDEKILLNELFQEEIVPKLVRLGARLGTINCGFAGEKYHKWNISFKSIGSDFMISDFEFDEDGASIDLDL